MDDLLKEINQFLNNSQDNKELDKYKKKELCKILINFIPNLESNDANNKILKSHNDIRFIYSSIYSMVLKEEIIQTQNNTIWTSVDKYIMIYIQEELNKKKEMDNDLKNNYIEILNKYQQYFNFDEYDLIPNIYGNFINIQKFKDYNCFPEEILNGIKKIFLKDLKKISPYKG